MKLRGTPRKSAATASRTTRKAATASSRRRSAAPTAQRNVLVTLAKATLNGWNIGDSCPPGRSSSEHSAGVSVSAVKPEITTAMATVTANCL